MAFSKSLSALSGAALLSVLAYGRRVEPGALEINPLELRLPRLDPAFDGLRIALFSDIHMGFWMNSERLAGIISRVNALQPDVVAITGDFITNRSDYSASGLTAALRELRPREVSVAVLGNHDHRHADGPAPVRRALRDSGIIELRNSVHTLRRNGAMLHLSGVDDLITRKVRLDRVLSALPEAGAAILLAHEPDLADAVSATGRFDLQLSGHSHGGQVIVPGLGPLVLPLYARRYPIGCYNVNGMILYTTRGVGVVSVRVRLNCRPEITLITLRSNNA